MMRLGNVVETPIPVEEAMKFLRIDDETQAGEVLQCLKFAYHHIFQRTNVIIPATTVDFEAKPKAKIYLPFSPVQTIHNVHCKLKTGVIEPIEPSGFKLFQESGFYVVENKNARIPADTESVIFGVICGYYDISEIPSHLVHIVLLITADCYELRQGRLTERIFSAHDIDSMLDSIKIFFDGELNA